MIHEALKRASQARHDLIERNMAPLLGALSFDDYIALLRRMLGFYGPLEARILALTGWQDIPLDLGRRAKAHLLERDLRYLGENEVGLALLPACEDLPEVSDIPQAFGCLYVLEGATLGGRVIAAHLGKHLGLDAEGGCAFFSSYGNDVGAKWKEFLGALESHCRDDDAGEVITRSIETLTALDRWLFDGEYGPWLTRNSLAVTPT